MVGDGGGRGLPASAERGIVCVHLLLPPFLLAACHQPRPPCIRPTTSRLAGRARVDRTALRPAQQHRAAHAPAPALHRAGRQQPPRLPVDRQLGWAGGGRDAADGYVAWGGRMRWLSVAEP